jgi:membrane protease subunit HflC
MNDNNSPNFGQKGPSFNNENVRPIRPVKKLPIYQFVIGALVLFAIMFGSSFVYIVAQDEVAVVKTFNETKKVIVDTDNELAQQINNDSPRFQNVEVVKGKGIFFKLPFVTTVEKHSSKLQTYVSNDGQVTTSDKVKYQVRLYAQWEITHPGLYETNYGSIINTSNRIDETLYADIINLINDLNSQEFLTDKEVVYEALDAKRIAYNEQNIGTGIYIHDLEIYRVGIPQSNYSSVYIKMQEERLKEAASIRAKGEKELASTKSEVDLEVRTIIAQAEQEAKTIRGQADADVIKIYADAFSANPEFYEFWRTLEAYENAIDENTTIYLDKSNSFLKYFSGFDSELIKTETDLEVLEELTETTEE